MAKGNKEHRMLFDIRGKRRNVVKVVYAVLAVLMGLSLFLVTGAANLGSLFGGSESESNAGAKIYEEQTARIERKLKQEPEDPELLLSLTRAQLNLGAQLAEQTPEGVIPTEETIRMYGRASETWADYLKATNEPSPSGAQSMSVTFVTLAENGSRSPFEFEENMKSAAAAQEILAEQRPNLNSLSTLAIYQYFAFEKAAAEKTRREAIALTKGKIERENLENQLDEYKKRAAGTEKQFKQLEAAQKAGAGQGKESLENPIGGLGGLGGTTLGE